LTQMSVLSCHAIVIAIVNKSKLLPVQRRFLSREEVVVMCSFCLRIVHDKDINDYQVARSRRADNEIVSRL
jgi:hypothetical protein